METGQERLREHPGERFAGVKHHFDLKAAAAKLRAEPHEGQRGHRQVTLFHRGAVAQVLFVFEAGGELPDHAANGLVSIHIVEGRMEVLAESEKYDLAAGGLLILNPGVQHSLKAAEPSVMLLTVTRENDS